MFVSEANEIASDFKFGSVCSFSAKLQSQGESGMFPLAGSDEEERNEELRKREVGSVCFIGVIEVNIGTRSVR